MSSVFSSEHKPRVLIKSLTWAHPDFIWHHLKLLRPFSPFTQPADLELIIICFVWSFGNFHSGSQDELNCTKPLLFQSVVIVWLWPDTPRPLGGDRNQSKVSHYYCTWLTKGTQSAASSRTGECFLEVAAAAKLIGCVEESLTPCHHLLRHLVVLMRWSTEWGIDSHLFRQHLSAEHSHRAKKKKEKGLRSSLTVGCNATEATSSYCIWQLGNSCNLFLVRVNNFGCDKAVRQRPRSVTSG